MKEGPRGQTLYGMNIYIKNCVCPFLAKSDYEWVKVQSIMCTSVSP